MLSFSSISCFAVALLSCWIQSSRAQNTTVAPYAKVAISSPTAASLGKFVDIPVANHTGIPQITVPIYTIREASLTLPLTLNYHAGGIKVQEPASWVGTGWALNAGGVITRSVFGAADERGTSSATKGHFSDYGYNSYLSVGGHYGNSNDPAPNGAAFANGTYDGEPYLFFFNFNGYSGKFYFSDDRTPVVVDGQELKIEYYYPADNSPRTGVSSNNNIQGFIITVPSGDRYYFGSTDATPYAAGGHEGAMPVEMSYTQSGSSPGIDNNIYSSYYLSKIIAADGIHTIQFIYQREKYSYYTILSFPVEATQLVANKGFQLASINLDGVRLTKINFTTGSVLLNATTAPRTDLGGYLSDQMDNTEAKALANIQIKAGSFCKEFTFAYSYFNGDTTPLAANLVNSSGTAIHTDQTRLKLDQVLERSCDSTSTTRPWRFTYNGSFLPRRLSLAQDHWGFYNGATQNNQLNTLIPTYYSGNDALTAMAGSAVPGANRDPDAQAMALGVLTQVTYPTGGTATFTYEPHDVWVSRKISTTQLVAQQSAGSGYGQNPYQAFSLTFSGNSYKFTLDYQHNFQDRYDGTGYFIPGSNDITGLGVGETNGLLLHAENVQTPPRGKVACELRANVAQSSGEGIQLQVFEYVTRIVTENKIVGGLRIKTTVARETRQAPGITTNYTYREATGHSSGTLFTRPRYVQVVRNDEIMQIGYGSFESSQSANIYPHGCINPETLNGGTNCQQLQLSPASIIPMTTTQGNHIGYSRVIISQSGVGRSEYQYYCDKDQELNTASQLGKVYDDVCYRTVNSCECSIATPSLPAPPTRFEFNRGQLASEQLYDEQGQLIKQVRYTYVYDSSRVVTPAWMVKNVALALLACSYERRGYWKTQTSVIETNYSKENKSFTTNQVTYFGKDYHHQLIRQLTIGSSGDTLDTRQQYVLDLLPTACTNLSDGVTAYNQERNASNATYATTFATCTTMGCRYRAYIDHLLQLADARQHYVAYRRVNFTDPANTFQTTHNQAIANADSQLKPVLQLQAAHHNEVVETSRWRNRLLLNATYTTFGPGLTQAAIMYPHQQFGLFISAPTPDFTPANLGSNTIRRDARYGSTPEWTLVFEAGALLQARFRTEPIVSYLWSLNHTLLLAKVTGVPYTTLERAYTEANSDLTAMRKHPLLAQSLLTCYTHQPLVGLLSQTDPTGRLISYEYDALGRLVRTRDEQRRILNQQQYHYAGQ